MIKDRIRAERNGRVKNDRKKTEKLRSVKRLNKDRETVE